MQSVKTLTPREKWIKNYLKRFIRKMGSRNGEEYCYRIAKRLFPE